MQPRSLEQRVTFLEQQMQELRELPARVERMESQILQLRAEMKDGFSAIRSDLRAELHGVEAGLRTELHEVRDSLRSELHEVRDSLRGEMRELRDALSGEMGELRDALRGEMGELREELREDVRLGVEESQNLTKVLHAEAMQVVSELRRDVVSKLDQILALRRDTDERPGS